MVFQCYLKATRLSLNCRNSSLRCSLFLMFFIIKEKNKIKRVIFASSIHSVGMYKVNQTIDHKVMQKPDTFYGLSKSFGENIAQMYWDKCGIECLCIRILSCAKVTSKRSLSTWLSYDDLIRIVIQSIKMKKLCFEIREILKNPSYDGYFVGRLNNFFGKYIRTCGLYPQHNKYPKHIYTYWMRECSVFQ